MSITQPKIKVRIGGERLTVSTGNQIITEYRDVTPDTGAYTTTPSEETQAFQTNGKRMTANFTVNPIPSNYGLITWNGTTLTVS